MTAYLLLALVAVYLAIAGGLWLFQERVLFPSYIIRPAGPLPAGATRLTIAAENGVALEGVHIPPLDGGRGDDLILAFAGNASNAQGIAEDLHDIYPGHAVVAFFYRGYPPSTGVTAAGQLVDDAVRVYDLVQERFRPRRIIAVGVSLGSGVAASLAARRPLSGLILVTPFDSLSATAGQLYPWLPVRWLLRHDIRSSEALRDNRTPVAIIAGGGDRLIRPERTAVLRASVRNLVFDETLAEAQHNDIPIHPRFRAAMREAMVRIEAAD